MAVYRFHKWTNFVRGQLNSTLTKMVRLKALILKIFSRLYHLRFIYL